MPVTPSDVYTIEFCVHNIVNPSLNYDVSLVSSIFGPNWDIHIPPELLSLTQSRHNGSKVQWQNGYVNNALFFGIHVRSSPQEQPQKKFPQPKIPQKNVLRKNFPKIIISPRKNFPEKISPNLKCPWKKFPQNHNFPRKKLPRINFPKKNIPGKKFPQKKCPQYQNLSFKKIPQEKISP